MTSRGGTRHGRLRPVCTWSALVLCGLVAAAPAANGAETSNTTRPAPKLEQRRDAPQTTVDVVSSTVMCPSCDTTLDNSSSPAAERMRTYVRAAVAAGWTQEEIRDGLVAEYGGDESILATPRAQGLGMAAYVVPGLLAGVALLVGVVMLRRWRRPAPPDAR